ncbi:DUF4173 domain-containing protein [Bradyrhizobium sp.]|uniref:DUF4153 domain-containing protein n=1 Tax=Bradyrhizobium sp. TaxID=376 RepID=UPI0027247987|nr:DUF4173 domain-containing protein [Bradyrhizobium sp.]MDO9294710.1 DUF4173 domain-containing protein [Bradyrhizobium sp.]
MSIATASDFAPAPARPLVTPLLLAAGCVALADWLFYGWQIGISLALFLAALGIAGVAGNRVKATRKIRIIMTSVFIAGLLAPIEDVNLLSVLLSSLATALFVLAMTAPAGPSWQRQLLEAVTVPLRGPFRLAGDLFAGLRHMTAWTPGWLGWLVGWIVPLSIFALFLGLLSSANPLIEHRVMQIDPRVLFRHFEFSRTLFWLLIACAIWPLIHRRIRPQPVRQAEPVVAATVRAAPDYLLGVQAMSRSLILFNALFALQSGLDLVYLWGGATLPDGMSYAHYAHRGAYPLIATALLAAGFVLIAMRPGGPAEQSRLIRPLVLAWIGQNILLVISSIFRLDLYVAAYSLTFLRLAAFIWMLLVATGLCLILIQIIKRKPVSWLVTANAVSLALVLYGCCFINAPRLVAAYNVAHSREAGGTGPWLDKDYLHSLGPEVLPVLEPHLPQIPALQSTVSKLRAGPDICENRRRRSENWRAMDFRTWRLQRYLANNPGMAQKPLDGDKG